MDRRAFLTALAAAGAWGPEAFALAPDVDAKAARVSAGAVKLDWTGATGLATVFVSSTPYVQARSLKRLAGGARSGVEVQAPTEPRPYFLIQSRTGEAWTAERLLPLQGGRNFRDLGGYRGEGGKQVRWGRIFRSGVMAGLTAADMAYLRQLGVATVCDLRSADERREEPTPFLKEPGAEVVAFDYEMGGALDAIARVKTRQEAMAAFAAGYVEFLDMLTPHYTEMFARLAEGKAPLALNCSAGKDRTGVGSALILSVLGVPREVVVADYGLTQVYTPPSMYMQAMSQQGKISGLTEEQARAMRQLPPEVLGVLMGSDPAVMRQTLAMIDSKFGGPTELVKTRFKLGDAGVTRMRSLYLV